MSILPVVIYSWDATEECSRLKNGKIVDTDFRKSCLFPSLIDSIGDKPLSFFVLNITHTNRLPQAISKEIIDLFARMRFVCDYTADIFENESPEISTVNTAIVFRNQNIARPDYSSRFHICSASVLPKTASVINLYFSKYSCVKILFVNMPMTKYSLPYTNARNSEELKFILSENTNVYTSCVNEIFESLVYKENANVLFLVGNFSYNFLHNQSINMNMEIIAQKPIEIYRKYDLLRILMQSNRIPQLAEGVEGNGPNYLPYTKIPSGQNYKEQLAELQNGKIPVNWYDRIFYQTYSEPNDPSTRIDISCLFYKSCYNKNNRYMATMAAFIMII